MGAWESQAGGESSREYFTQTVESRPDGCKALGSSDLKSMPRTKSYALAAARILSPVSENAWRKGRGGNSTRLPRRTMSLRCCLKSS